VNTAPAAPVTGPLEKPLKRHKKLMEMLTYCRVHNSTTELEFINKYLSGFGKESWVDTFGNIHVCVGNGDSKTLFSCHIDTVHTIEGTQKLNFDPTTGHIFLADSTKYGYGNCLGADDGAGIWLMLEMIKSRIPGYYIFHRDEESGGIGSKWLADNFGDVLRAFDRAIAFDRKGRTDIINVQRSNRCCSDEFVKALAKEMEDNGVENMSAARGTFTDTASYTGLIPECTNISVGYYYQHSAQEVLDITFLEKLRKAVLKIDWESLPTVREAKKNDPAPYNAGSTQSKYQTEKQKREEAERIAREDFLDASVSGSEIMLFVQKYPLAAAKLLEYLDITHQDVVMFIDEAEDITQQWLKP
jgi:acetylornithine deacetylase/succinyl-diaminopimelate desuccinylase-like protein